MALKLGYLLPTRERIVTNDHSARPILALADHAEQIGLDSVWIGDSLLAKPRHEPLAMLAAIAGRTERIVIGTAILLPMLRNPVLLAHQAATLDQISEGRLILGLGTARDTPPIRREFEAAGVDFDKRIGRMLEQVRLCRALWNDAPVNWESDRYSVREAELAPRPWRAGGPSLWGGGGVEGALKRVGRYFDGWMPSGAGTPAAWGEKWEQIKQFAVSAERDPSALVGSAYVTIAVSDSQQNADAELDHYLEGYYNQPAALIREQQYCFAGSRDAASDWLAGFVEAGASHIVVRFTGTDDQAQMDALRLIRQQLDGQANA